MSASVPDRDAIRALIFEHAGLAMFATDVDCKIVEWNAAASALFGRSRAEALGESAGEATGAGELWPGQAALGEHAAPGQTWTGDVQAPGDGAAPAWFRVTMARPAADSGGAGMLTWAVEDVTEERRARAELERLASTDELTGLLNRRQFDIMLAQAVRLAVRRRTPGALVFVDIDNLKGVNDNFGHATGDAVLQAAGSVLRSSVRASDVVARVGGDEFSLILFDVEPADALAKAREVLERVRAVGGALRRPPIPVGASAGVAIFPEHSDDPRELFTMADRAMYEAKAAGPGDAAVHVPGKDRPRHAGRPDERRRLILDALADDRLVLYRQPIVDLDTGEPALYEVLARICDTDGRLRQPDEFIPDAERLDLIQQLDRAVARMTAERWRACAVAGERPTLAVNVSARSLDPEFARYAIGLADEHEIPPEYLYFEITETAVARSAAGAASCLSTLADAGFGLMIDDFGAGVTSFRQLREFPLSAVKLYGPLVRDMGKEPHGRDAVAALANLAHTLHLAVVAEWVEDEATARLVAELGVDLGQGFHFGRPEEFAGPGRPG